MRKDGIIEAPALELTCAKLTYLSKKEANHVLSQIAKVDQDHKKPVRSYECERCGGWHLTSKP